MFPAARKKEKKGVATRYYVDAEKADEAIARITRRQIRTGEFFNVAVKPYKGKKYGKKTTVVIVVG